MALTKRFYTNHKTVITAENMNDIQDAIIALEALAGIVPGEGEATRNISVVNRNGNFTLVETVGLPDGLYWFDNPVTFKDDTQTETFQLYGLVAKTENGWLNYDTGRACVTDDLGVLVAWTYTSLPEANLENEGNILAVVDGKWEVTEPQQVFPLEEAHVSPTNEPQELLPGNGYCGFSKIYVDAAPEGGGGDSGGDIVIGGAAEDTTFGDDYYNVPTGNYDYSAGADENPNYIPEIPGTGFKALFSKKLKASKHIKFVDGYYHSADKVFNEYEIKSDTGEFYVYKAWARNPANGSTHLIVYMYATDRIAYQIKSRDGIWRDKNDLMRYSDADGWFCSISGTTVFALWNELPDYEIPSGIPVFCLGDLAEGESFDALARDIATSSDVESLGADQMIAFVSDTQILYDGSVINNTDNSPMTIYECDSNGANAWTQIGTTDGTDYPVSGYTLVWNSHDLKDMTGQYVTESKSDEPLAEMSMGDVGIPVERNETYSIEGSTVNAVVSAAQKVTGGKKPQTPHEAALALDEYYNHPAEEGKW